MVRMYRKKWKRNLLTALLCYIRDSIVIALPVRRLPRFLIKLLYGSEAKFAFFVHPRSYQDITTGIPFFEPIKLLLRRERAYRFLAHINPFILNTVSSRQGIDGIVVAQPTVPEVMFSRRKETVKMLIKAMQLVSKISTPRAVVGLGGWYPMITARGTLLETYAKRLKLVVTNGHCGTLASIVMMVRKILGIINLPMNDASLAVIGVGKMGTNVARAFNGNIGRLILIDTRESSLSKAREQLNFTNNKTKIELVLSSLKDASALRAALRYAHLGVCATSTFRNLLKLRDMPVGFIAIDDSRPEALPRDPRLERIILEGGLLKIKNAQINYNFGFGQDDNVFGCLGEAFAMALDAGKSLEPTLGEVDMDNFNRFLTFCEKNEIMEGDLRSCDVIVTEGEVCDCFENRKKSLPLNKGLEKYP